VFFYVLFVCKCVLPPGDNPNADNKYITNYGTPTCFDTIFSSSGELVINTLASYSSISNAAVGNTIYN